MPGEKIGEYTERTIKLSDLELDRKNPRIGVHEDQNATINAMLSRKSTDIDEMAESIARNGFLTLEIPCVYPSTKRGKFVVAEGNRRLTALKVLHTPDLAQGSRKYQKFKSLSNSAKGKLPTEIKCAVFKNARECMPYVLMRHGLGGDGASLKRWDALEKRRVDQATSGKPHQGLKVIDFILDQGSLSSKHEDSLATIKITNLERLTDSATVRKLLEVKKDDCTDSAKGEEWIVPVWQRIIEIILDEEHLGQPFSVNNIYYADDQERFIHEVLHEVHKIPIPAPTPGSGGGSSSGKDTSGAGGSNKTRPASKRTGGSKPSHKTTRQRKGLIAKNFSPSKLGPQKIINLVEELKNLPAENFKTCSGVMFRVLMEVSIHHYMKKANIQKVDAQGKELSEHDKRLAVLKHLKSTGAHDARTFKALEDTLTNNHPVSAQSLNYYVHSKTHSPSGSELKTQWDNLQHIFEIMWDI